jgi:hypothetical protein
MVTAIQRQQSPTKRPKKKIKNKKNIKNRGQPFTLYCRRERKEKEKK